MPLSTRGPSCYSLRVRMATQWSKTAKAENTHIIASSLTSALNRDDGHVSSPPHHLLLSSQRQAAVCLPIVTFLPMDPFITPQHVPLSQESLFYANYGKPTQKFLRIGNIFLIRYWLSTEPSVVCRQPLRISAARLQIFHKRVQDTNEVEEASVLGDVSYWRWMCISPCTFQAQLRACVSHMNISPGVFCAPKISLRTLLLL
ncbi:hypothetical protein H4582DRAFT_779119 [Lactarius indigo]|nr:hypothetical protein H4582DRAFT_779119 [Lactarius indigo]